jgi:hypothetical protein
LDIGYVNGFVEVSFPRENHWRKGKRFMEKGFRNKRLERRPLVNLRMLEPPKENILGREGGVSK